MCFNPLNFEPPGVSEIRQLKDENYRLKAENKRLQAIVDKLPKTEDGVIITPGMKLFFSSKRFFPAHTEISIEEERVTFGPFCGYYSTREAIEAAKGGG